MMWGPSDYKAEFLSAWSTEQAWRYVIADARRRTNVDWGRNEPIRVYLGCPGQYGGLLLVSYDESEPVPYDIPDGILPAGEVENCSLALLYVDPEYIRQSPLTLVQYGRAWEEWNGPVGSRSSALFIRATAEDAAAFLEETGTIEQTIAARCDPEWTVQKVLDFVSASDLSTLPYAEYLKTDHWRDIRLVALDRAGYRCQICNTNNKTLHAHHRTYERRGFEDAADLIVLCASCHATFHKKLPKDEE